MRRASRPSAARCGRDRAAHGRVILDTAFGKSFGEHELVDAVCSGPRPVGPGAMSRCRRSVPVVAVGGPVRVYYGEVGRRLGCEVVFPPFFDVANAVGAATGVVAQTVTITVEGDGSGLFRVHGPAGVGSFTSGAAALARGRSHGRAAALRGGPQLGADDPRCSVSIEKHTCPMPWTTTASRSRGPGRSHRRARTG